MVTGHSKVNRWAGIEGPLRILIVRPDRLGDVVLSTPVFEAIKRHYPNAHLTALVQAMVIPVLRGLPHVDHFMTFDPDGKHKGIRGFFRLCSELRVSRFRIVVVLQSQWKIAAAALIAGIPTRIGPLSKLHSFLFYNKGVRQHRSDVEMHEADYNLQLLRRLGIRMGTRTVPTRIHVSEQTKKGAKKWLEERACDLNKPLVMIHPGMGGSALNWPESNYHELILGLMREGYQVLVTAGPAEGALLDRVKKILEATLPQPQKSQYFLFHAQPGQGLDFLAGLCFYSSLVVAPSTGPLHLAVAM